jgi:uncharacterized membrane protein
MTEPWMSAVHPASIRWAKGRVPVEALTLAVLIVPMAWLALHWSGIPAVSPHLHRGRMSLWVMPTFMVAVYLILSEFGLLKKTDILRRGHRLSSLKPIFLAYSLVARLEVLALLAVLSLATDYTAMTGRAWAAKEFIEASSTVIALTILLFTVVVTRAGYRLGRPSA